MQSINIGHCGFVLLVASLVCVPSEANDQGAAHVEPQSEVNTTRTKTPDVFAHVALVRSELELIRFEMGRPNDRQSEIDVTNAAFREVFFQALTLFRKANRLCFEQTHERKSAPQAPKGEILPNHVFAVVNATLDRIQRVKTKLRITEQIGTTVPAPNKTPTDVFRSIVQANRQLNLLLDRQFAPSDVFQQVTLAVSYASRLLAQFPEVTRIPDAPVLERGKRPADVYRRLSGCYQLVAHIANQSGLEMLSLKTEGNGIEEVTPSDVYDIASLVVSELAYLHSHLQGVAPPREVHYPGRKFPAHTYQRAGILKVQLTKLEKLVVANPAWLPNTN